MRRLRGIALLGSVLLIGCPEEPEPQCSGQGELDLVATPSLFNYPALADGERVPIYIPFQGGVFTELDLEVTGAARDDIASFTFTVRLDGGDVIANPPPTMTFPFDCREDGLLLMELMPVAFNWSEFDIMELDERDATIVIQMQLKGGQAPVTREYDVVLDYRTFN
jgi:hypothetical protein